MPQSAKLADRKVVKQANKSCCLFEHMSTQCFRTGVLVYLVYNGRNTRNHGRGYSSLAKNRGRARLHVVVWCMDASEDERALRLTQGLGIERPI